MAAISRIENGNFILRQPVVDYRRVNYGKNVKLVWFLKREEKEGNLLIADSPVDAFPLFDKKIGERCLCLVSLFPFSAMVTLYLLLLPEKSTRRILILGLEDFVIA